jgi:hypothetical protein
MLAKSERVRWMRGLKSCEGRGVRRSEQKNSAGKRLDGRR